MLWFDFLVVLDAIAALLVAAALATAASLPMGSMGKLVDLAFPSSALPATGSRGGQAPTLTRRGGKGGRSASG